MNIFLCHTGKEVHPFLWSTEEKCPLCAAIEEHARIQSLLEEQIVTLEARLDAWPLHEESL